MPSSCSPPIRSAARLVTTSLLCGEAASRRPSSGAASSTCSKLSITSSTALRASTAAASPSPAPSASAISVATSARVLQPGQRDEPRAVAELRREPVGELEREVRLADPAGAGEREQPHVRVGSSSAAVGEIVLAAEQRRGGTGSGGADAAAGGGAGRRVELERRILGEDRGLQALQLRAGSSPRSSTSAGRARR